MKKIWRKLLMGGLLGSSLIIGSVVEAGVVTDRLPLQCYADHQVNTYNSPGVAKRAGSISANVDLIKITQVRSDGWCYGSYPGAGGKRVSRWFRITDVCADAGYTNRSANVKGKQTVYRTRSGGATLGSVSNNEGVIVVADNGSRAQIVYRLDNGIGYKLGWVSSAAVPSDVNVKKGDMNGDGIIDKRDADILDQCFLNKQWTAQQLKAGDFDGNGKIDLKDVSRLDLLLHSNKPIDYGKQVTDKMQYWSQNANGYRVNTKYTGSGQCRGFANRVYTSLFSVSSITGYTSSNYGAASYSGSRVVGTLYNFAANNTTGVQNLFRNAKPGSFVQMGRRNSLNSTKTAPSPHSAIIFSVSSGGVEFYEANTDGKNTIKINYHSWADLANKNKGFTIYEPNNYVMK